jgi:hypothetical protein
MAARLLLVLNDTARMPSLDVRHVRVLAWVETDEGEF